MNKLNILIAIIILFLTQCDVLDQPYYEGSDEKTAFSSPKRIAATAIGMYDALQYRQFLGGRALIYGDIRGNDVGISTFFGLMSVYRNTSSDSNSENAWYGAYYTIFVANSFLKNLESHKNIVPDMYNIYKGEAKFIRALAYFYAINFWGQTYQYTPDASHLGIPLALIPADENSAFTDAFKLPRVSVHKIYEQMIEDLDFAEKNLPEKRESNFKTVALATSPAAQALLARIYLYMGKYNKVIEYANKLNASSRNFSLNPNVETIFRKPETGSETIFFIAHNDKDNPNTNHALGQHYNPKKRGDITVSSDYISLMDIEKDERYLKLIHKDDNNVYWTKKYIETWDWVPVLRYSEILLSKAEALVKSTNTIDVEAVSILSDIRQRAGLDPCSVSDFVSSEDLLKAILKERKIELAFEGQGSFDFFRNKEGIPKRGNEAAISYPNNMFVLPIPKKDTDKNPNLIQNPGY